MTPAKYVRYKERFGFVKRGTEPVTLDLFDRTLHMHVATWLTAQLEAGALGTTQNYDGAGFSIGFLHELAVYPSTLEQGTAWRLLFEAPRAPELDALIKAAGWELRREGVYVDGVKVKGEAIRVQTSGPGGVTPKSGPQHERARAWVEALCATFANHASVPAQIASAMRWLAGGHRVDEAHAYKMHTTKPAEEIRAHDLPLDFDLAMCVYHSFSVNAPSLARKYLLSVPSDARFAKTLVQRFRSSTYGNWQARYDRTRAAALRSGIWPASIVASVMPAR